MLELQAAMRLSRLWQNQGKKEQARKLLNTAYSKITEGFTYGGHEGSQSPSCHAVVMTPNPHEIGIGATAELSLRVSVATLVRVLIQNPNDDELMLALERKATLRRDGRWGRGPSKIATFRRSDPHFGFECGARPRRRFSL